MKLCKNCKYMNLVDKKIKEIEHKHDTIYKPACFHKACFSDVKRFDPMKGMIIENERLYNIIDFNNKGDCIFYEEKISIFKKLFKRGKK